MDVALVLEGNLRRVVSEVLQQIDAKMITGCTFRQPNHVDRTCTVERGTSKFIIR